MPCQFYKVTHVQLTSNFSVDPGTSKGLLSSSLHKLKTMSIPGVEYHTYLFIGSVQDSNSTAIKQALEEVERQKLCLWRTNKY